MLIVHLIIIVMMNTVSVESYMVDNFDCSDVKKKRTMRIAVQI